MTLLDLAGALALLVSLIVVLVMGVRLLWRAARGRWSDAARQARWLGGYVGAYAVVLVAVALTMPRDSRVPGERECFDDWCAAGVAAQPATGSDAPCAAAPDSRVWVATIEVSSDAKRVRQRALDAQAVLEDAGGREYGACAPPLGRHALADQIGPGEAFTVMELFRIPAGAVPAGVVISHGAFPGVLLIGDDQSLFHRRTLLAVSVRDR